MTIGSQHQQEFLTTVRVKKIVTRAKHPRKCTTAGAIWVSTQDALPLPFYSLFCIFCKCQERLFHGAGMFPPSSSLNYVTNHPFLLWLPGCNFNLHSICPSPFECASLNLWLLSYLPLGTLTLTSNVSWTLNKNKCRNRLWL